uniref:Uncharacterized protein n=1 Tax=Anguilla anguilla TaxID=7936 RepID=A0A0E9PTL6_ANGAN
MPQSRNIFYFRRTQLI